MILVRALGASEIQIGKKKITLSAELVFALALYLCTRAGERLTRDEVTEMFWGEGHDVQGRHSLRQMLYRLRQKGLTLDEEGEELYLDPARVESDLNAALRESWVASADSAAVGAAASLTPGFSRHISERFQEWYDGIRHRLAAQHRRAALRQISVARREGRWSDVDRWALEVLRSDPLNEEATLARAESAAMAGSKAMALEIIDAYMEELGDRAARIGLPATVLRRRIAERRPEWSGRGPRDVPLVGRSKLMARLTGFVEAAGRGEGSAVILWGAPGIGKTRLAEETRAFAELGGFRTVFVRATVASSTRPLSVLLSLIPLLRDLPGAAGCDPSSLAILNRAASHHVEPSDFDSGLTARSLREAVLVGLQDLIDAITVECRLFIFLDDVHNADPASWEMLQALMTGTLSRRVMWIGTSRIRPSWTARSIEPSAHGITPLHVPPLDEYEATSLAEAVIDSRRDALSAADLAKVAQAAGGNPLFVCELSAHRASKSSAGALPSSLRELMQERLERFEPDLMRVMRLTTLLGGFATISRIQALTARDETDLVRCVEQLESEGLLHFGSSRSLDLHECWHEAISEDMSAAVRATLSLQCAQQLAAELDRTEVPELWWRTAELFADAGETDRAVRLFSSCGEQMLSRGFPAEACAVLTRAADSACTGRERLLVLAQLARAQAANGHLDAAVETCSQALALNRGATEEELVAYATVLALRADGLSKLHRDHRGDLSQLADLAKNEALPPSTRHFVCLTGMGIALAEAISVLEQLFFDESQRVTQRFGNSTLGCVVALIHHAEHGDIQSVFRVNRLLSSLENEPLPLTMRCRALRTRVTALRFIGQFDESAALAERAYSMACNSGLAEDAVFISEAMTFAKLDLDDASGSSLWLDRWKRSRVTPSSAERDQAMIHASSRWCAQRGAFAAALTFYDSNSECGYRDLSQIRRLVDLATIAMCAAGVGRREDSIAALTRISTIINDNSPSFRLDYVVEMSLRAFDLLRQLEQKQQFGYNYARRRLNELPLPIAPFFRELQAHADFVTRQPAERGQLV